MHARPRGLIVIEHHRRAVPSGAIEPEVGLGRRRSPRLANHLQRRFVRVQDVAGEQDFMHPVVEGFQPVGAGEHPVRQRLAGERHPETGETLFLPIEREPFDKLLTHDKGHRGGRGQTVREGRGRHRRGDDGRLDCLLLALAAAVFVTEVLHHRHARGDDLEFLPDLLHVGQFMERAAAAGADALGLWQVVFDLVHGQMPELHLPLALGFAAVIRDRLDRRFRRGGGGFRFGLIEHQRRLLRRGLFAGRAELAVLRQTKLLLQPVEFRLLIARLSAPVFRRIASNRVLGEFRVVSSSHNA